MDSAGRVPGNERVYFSDRHSIEITGNRLLERARRDDECERAVERTPVEDRENQACREAITATDAIDEADDIALALVKAAGPAIPGDGTPAVIAGPTGSLAA